MAYDDYAAQVESMRRRREMAQLMMQGGGDRIGSVDGVVVPFTMGEGLAQLARAWLGGRAQHKVDEEERDLRKKRSEDVARALSGVSQSVPDDQVGHTALQRINATPEGELPEPVTGRSDAMRRLALELMPSEDVPALEYKRQLLAESGPQGVQSTVIGDDGYYYTVDRATGKLTNTGTKAAPNMRVVEQEGNTPFGVVTGRGPAGSVIPLGGPPPSGNGGGAAQSAPAAGPIRTPTAGERARDVASAQAGVELATKPEIAKQTELAKTEAERTAALPGQLADLQKMRRNIEGLLDSPGFDTIYGMSRRVSPSMLPGQTGADSQARLGQIDAQAFQNSIQSMRGLGALSNAEGLKVSAAFTRATDTNQSEEAAREAWGEVIDGLTIAEERLRTGTTLRGEAPGAPPAGAIPEFATEADAESAAAAGKIKPGQRIKVGGQTGVWQ